MTIGQKLKKLREALKKIDKKWTLDFVAQNIGVTKGAVSQYENDDNRPSPEILYSIAKLYGVKLEEILEPGKSALEGSTYEREIKTGSLIPAKKAHLYLSQLPEKDAADYIPYYDVEITAGRIELYFDDIKEIPEGYVYAPQYRGCVMCNVKGNSMYNLIYPGARLYVYQLHDKKYIDFGQVYLVVLNTMRVLKYIRRHPTDDTKITLSSHNKDHDDWDVEKADIIGLFQVKGFENQMAM